MLRLKPQYTALTVVVSFLVMTVLNAVLTLVLMQREIALQLQLARTEETLKAWQQRRVNEEKIQDTRTEALELAVFGAKPPEPSAVALWQKNRDKELRDAINSIQRRMLILENK